MRVFRYHSGPTHFPSDSPASQSIRTPTAMASILSRVAEFPSVPSLTDIGRTSLVIDFSYYLHRNFLTISQFSSYELLHQRQYMSKQISSINSRFSLRSVVLLAVHLHVVALTLVAVLSFVIRMGSLLS